MAISMGRPFGDANEFHQVSLLVWKPVFFASRKSVGIKIHQQKIRSQPTKRESNGDFIQTRDANTNDGWSVPLKCDMSGGFKDILEF